MHVSRHHAACLHTRPAHASKCLSFDRHLRICIGRHVCIDMCLYTHRARYPSTSTRIPTRTKLRVHRRADMSDAIWMSHAISSGIEWHRVAYPPLDIAMPHSAVSLTGDTSDRHLYQWICLYLCTWSFIKTDMSLWYRLGASSSYSQCFIMVQLIPLGGTF